MLHVYLHVYNYYSQREFQAVEDVGFGTALDFTLRNHSEHNVTYQYFNGWKGFPHRVLYDVVGSDWWGKNYLKH